jgi:hypothetical protein
MKINIPDNWLGEKIEGSIEKVLAEKPAMSNQTRAQTNTEKVYEINDPRNYIQVPQFDIVIARKETHRGKNMYDTLESLASEGLKMPSLAQFMTHWVNVKEAVQGKRGLVYADGSPVGNDVAQDLWNYMSSRDRDPWNGEISWTWLNSLFRKDGNDWYIEADLEGTTDANGRKSLKGTKAPLNTCLREDSYASINLNSQGLPTDKSSVQEYRQGENFYFWHPRNNAVAGFDAGSDGADLDCGGDPDERDSSLGVFACAEGTAAQKFRELK